MEDKKIRLMVYGLVLVSVMTILFAEYMVWNETVTWLSDEMVRFQQEDNSFLASTR